MVILYFLFQACERPEYMTWYEKLGISLWIIGPIMIILGTFLATYGANYFVYIVASLIFIIGGFLFMVLFTLIILNPYSKKFFNFLIL